MNYKKISYSYIPIFIFWAISSYIYIETQGRSFEGLIDWIKQVNTFFVDFPIFLLLLFSLTNVSNAVAITWFLFYFIGFFYFLRKAYKTLFSISGNLDLFIFLVTLFLLNHLLAMLFLRELSEGLGKSILSILKSH